MADKKINYKESYLKLREWILGIDTACANCGMELGGWTRHGNEALDEFGNLGPLPEPVEEQETDKIKPDCYRCKYGTDLIENIHFRCSNTGACVERHTYDGNGTWVDWPRYFNANGLISCDSFEERAND